MSDETFIKLEDAIAVVRDMAAQYPTDIWPEDGTTTDAKAARIARLVCRNIENRLAEVPVWKASGGSQQ